MSRQNVFLHIIHHPKVDEKGTDSFASRNRKGNKNMPTAYEILKKKFMEPFGLNSNTLSKAIHVPTSRTLEILYGHRRITPDTSIRLGRLFGVEDDYFLILQGKDDMVRLREKLKEELEQIRDIRKG